MAICYGHYLQLKIRNERLVKCIAQLSDAMDRFINLHHGCYKCPRRDAGDCSECMAEYAHNANKEANNAS